MTLNYFFISLIVLLIINVSGCEDESDWVDGFGRDCQYYKDSNCDDTVRAHCCASCSASEEKKTEDLVIIIIFAAVGLILFPLCAGYAFCRESMMDLLSSLSCGLIKSSPTVVFPGASVGHIQPTENFVAGSQVYLLQNYGRSVRRGTVGRVLNVNPSDGAVEVSFPGEDNSVVFLPYELRWWLSLEEVEASPPRQKRKRKKRSDLGPSGKEAQIPAADLTEEFEHDYRCSICMEIKNGNIYRCENNHRLCAGCLHRFRKSYPRRNVTCPQCRVVMKEPFIRDYAAEAEIHRKVKGVKIIDGSANDQNLQVDVENPISPSDLVSSPSGM